MQVTFDLDASWVGYGGPTSQISRPSAASLLQKKLVAALRRLVRDHCGFDCPEIEAIRVPSAPEWR
jgi:hypothetical protein